MSSSVAARTPPLATERLLLRDLEDADHAATNAWESDPLVVRYQSTDVATPEESLAYIRKVRAEAASQSPRRLFDLAIVRRSDATLIGRCGLHVVRPEHREAELWYVVRRDAWGHGLATEAARALVGFGFEALGLHRVWADCDPRNLGSIRVVEKLGMRREGHLRENWFLKGEWCDSFLYAVLDREWRER